MLVWILAVGVILTTVLGGGYLLWKKIPQRYYLHKGAMASALHVAHEGHDVVAQVEWADNQVTFMGADFKPGDEQIVLDNGLPIEVVGNGADPVYLSGVPIIKMRAEHAAPVDTEAAIAMGREEDGDYKLVYEDGQVIERENLDDDVDGSVSMDDSPAANVDNPEEMLETDGGQTTPPGEAVDHKYDTSAQDGAEGVAFSLEDATNYAPFSLNPGSLKKAYDIGKREGQNTSHIKMLLMGMGVLLAILLFIAIVGVAVYKILGLGGGGGGGGGSETINSTLALLAMGLPATSTLRDEVATATKRVRRRYSWRRLTANIAESLGTLAFYMTFMTVLGVQAVLLTLVLRPELTSDQLQQVGTVYGVVTLVFGLGVVLLSTAPGIRPDTDGNPVVTVSEYIAIRALDEELTTYDAIADEAGADYEAVLAVLEDKEYRLVQDVDPTDVEG